MVVQIEGLVQMWLHENNTFPLQIKLHTRSAHLRKVPFKVGVFAAGEVNGFGGGRVHGHNALEGTFLVGCILSGRAVGRALAKEEYN